MGVKGGGFEGFWVISWFSGGTRGGAYSLLTEFKGRGDYRELSLNEWKSLLHSRA